MDRREFLAAMATPLLLPFAPAGCDLRQLRRAVMAGAPLALATADTESHVAVLSVTSGRVRARLATVEGPRSIEASGVGRALVAHTTEGAISLLEGPPMRVRRVLRGMGEPRYFAVAPDGRHAYVTDSARGEVAVIDLVRGLFVGGAAVGALARHVSIAPDGRTLWVVLGSRAAAVAVVDLSDPIHPRRRGQLHPPFLAHDVACSPGGRRLWLTSGDRERLALYRPGHASPLAVLPAGAPPQHVTFGAGRVYVASGEDGSLHVQHVGDGRILAQTRVAKGSYNVQHGARHIVTPSLDDGTVTILAEAGGILVRTRIAQAAHDACIV